MTRHGRMKGKTAMITGAASGIGKATAFLFAKEGARLALADISEKPLAELAESLKQQGAEVMIKVTDVEDEEQIKAFVDATLHTFKTVDVLCNNAGITGKMPAIDKEETENWIHVYRINVLGAMLAIKYLAPHMMERKQGSIVNTASVAGVRAGAGPNAYSASKAALMNFTQTAACDLGAFNVRVNTVCPGLIKTGMTQPLFDYASQVGKEDRLGNRCELRRHGLPEEVAAAILFFASDDSSYITGQCLPVDGGNTASLNLPGMKA
ncbi:MAG: SDR family oxidoreductase [Desulfobacteraceae bacterium]|nr:SDR family oxidoreductase [Desulfobacteraceae bacterium]MBU4001581.1 SDR family oxidoreductase [Pseudomonadota bacterium]